jgi:glycerophosphoryl diester phosphodiesterase
MRLASFLLAAGLAACTARPAGDPDLTAPALAMDCFREQNFTMLAAHRGGPAPGYPENALSSLRRLADRGVLYAEIDVRRSADGVLFLLHDDSLDRTTTGTGPVDGLAWPALATLRLRDPDGAVVEDTIPTLADALALARETGLVLNLDLKSVPHSEIVGVIDAHNARDDVAVIAYTVEATAALHSADPGLLVSAPDDVAALTAAGVNLQAIYLWTGVGTADARADAAFAARQLETSVGLFPLETGEAGIYLDAAAAGVELLAIDDVETAVAALGGAARLRSQIAACAAD